MDRVELESNPLYKIFENPKNYKKVATLKRQTSTLNLLLCIPLSCSISRIQPVTENFVCEHIFYSEQAAIDQKLCDESFPSSKAEVFTSCQSSDRQVTLQDTCLRSNSSNPRTAQVFAMETRLTPLSFFFFLSLFLYIYIYIYIYVHI